MTNRPLEQTAFRAVCDAVAHGLVFVDARGSFVEANPAAERILRRNCQTLLAEGLFDEGSSLRTEDGTEIPTGLLSGRNALADAEQGRKRDIAVTWPDGKTGWLRIAAVALPNDGALLAIEDMTERRDGRRDIDPELQLRHELFQHISDSLFIVDPITRQILHVNSTTCRQLGYTGEELREMRLEQIDPVFPMSAWPAHVAALRESVEGLTLETTHRRKDGSLLPVEVHVRLTNDAGDGYIVGTARDITKRKRGEENLRRDQERLREVLDFQPIPVSIAEGKAIIFCNRLFTESYGYTVQDIPTLADWFRAAYPEPSHRAEVLARWDQDVAEAAAQGTSTQPREYVVTCKDGTEKTVVISGRQVGAQFIASFVDVTERKEAEVALRQSEARFRALVENAPDAIVVLDVEEGKFVDVNENACALFQLRREELFERGPGELSPLFQPDGAASAAGALAHIQEAVRGRNPRFEWTHVNARGEEIPCEVNLTRLPSSKRILVRGSIVDITDRRRTEAERVRLQEQLLRAQRMESLGSLASGVAHDMNNVLGAILGLASASLYTQTVGSDTKDTLETIIKACDRGGTMVRGLLSFARQAPAQQRELQLNELLREEALLLERTTLARVALVLELAENLVPIEGDPGALSHAIMNLCVNAVDAMPEGGTLTLRTRQAGPDWVEVTVQDEGEGMPPEVAERAFEPFFTTKPEGKGTGLGLAMVYGTAKAHGGEVEIDSQPGRGTMVRLRFPCRATASRDVSSLRNAVVPASPREHHVLVVDDDDLLRNALRKMVRRLGHRVTVVESGESALSAIEEGLAPDVVILDVNMPGIGGKGALPRLRVLRPTIPVLLATGRADPTALELAESTPNVSLLLKPFQLAQLGQSLRRALERA